MAEFLEVLERATLALKKHDLKYVVVGGTAAIILGKPRTTMDIDLIVEDDMAKIKLFLESLNQESFDVSMEQARMGFSMNENVSVFDKTSILRLDIKVARNQDEKTVLDNAEYATFHDLTVRLARPEDILFGKIWFLGDISDLEDFELLKFNDVQDFLNVFQMHRKLDLEQLRKRVKQKKLEPTLDRMLSLAKKLAGSKNKGV